jgi:predicted acyl esterase
MARCYWRFPCRSAPKPLPETWTSPHLAPDRALTTEPGPGSDSFVYDPLDPVPSAGGTSRTVCEGITRLVFRPGSPIRIELSPTSYYSVRLQISSSSFPPALANPNTGRNWLIDPHEPVVAEQTVFHSSRLILPVTPADR